MKVAVAPPHDSIIAVTLLEYHQQSGLKWDSPYETCTEQAKKFLKSASEFVIGEIKSLGCPDMEMYTFPSSWPNNKKYQFIDGLGRFYHALYGVATGRKPMFPDMKGVERKPLPSLAAFKWEGHNDLDISHAPGNYALNFY